MAKGTLASLLPSHRKYGQHGAHSHFSSLSSLLRYVLLLSLLQPDTSCSSVAGPLLSPFALIRSKVIFGLGLPTYFLPGITYFLSSRPSEPGTEWMHKGGRTHLYSTLWLITPEPYTWSYTWAIHCHLLCCPSLSGVEKAHGLTDWLLINQLSEGLSVSLNKWLTDWMKNLLTAHNEHIDLLTCWLTFRLAGRLSDWRT